VASLGGGRYQVVDGSRRRLAFASSHGDATWVYLDGRVHVVPLESRASRGAGRQDDELAMAAPMPATVVAVNVVPGQPVAPGEVLIMLEAMKMEVAIKAPREGTVKSVACHAGELVQPGVPLVELD
jgi:3-methylcrotonyl-CoA carboxylase alpha subunit